MGEKTGIDTMKDHPLIKVLTLQRAREIIAEQNFQLSSLLSQRKRLAEAVVDFWKIGFGGNVIKCHFCGRMEHGEFFKHNPDCIVLECENTLEEQ